MYNTNAKKIKKGKRKFYIFLAIGVSLLLSVGGIFALNIIKMNNLDSKIMSTKVEVKSYVNDSGNTMYSSVYHYRINGQDYSCNSNVSSNDNLETENKNIYYNSTNPSICMIEYSKTGNYIMLIIIPISIIIIFFAIINIKKTNKKIKSTTIINPKDELIKKQSHRLEKMIMSKNNDVVENITLEEKTNKLNDNEQKNENLVEDNKGYYDDTEII